MVEQRRPEIVEDFDREVLGRVPRTVPKVAWRVNRTEQFQVGGADRSWVRSSSAPWTTPGIRTSPSRSR